MPRTIAWIAGALLASGALIWGAQWWHARTTQVVEPPPVAQAPAPEPPAAPPAPKIEYPIEPGQDTPQIALDASDAPLGDALAHLFKGNRLPEFVQPVNLIRHIVATIDNLPREKAAPRLLPVRPTAGALSTVTAGESLVIAADNSARYAPVIAAAQAVDTKQLVAIYVRFYPLFQQAYRELGYPGGQFNDRLVAVIDHLLVTPTVKAPIALVQPKVLYRYADPELEALSSGQKAMLRIGPDNAAVLKAKLREVRNEVTGTPVTAR
ncbi:MAG: DUF3014 domain-containing protein [Burkholderiaceae bacterium]